VLPVRIATDRVREFDALSGDPDEVRARESEHIPLRRYGEPEEFARVAAGSRAHTNEPEPRD
jgi:3-oxoacyl-[acyl-carrier protein] reductase